MPLPRSTCHKLVALCHQLVWLTVGRLTFCTLASTSGAWLGYAGFRARNQHAGTNGAFMTMTFIWSHIRRTGQLMKARILLADDHPRFPEMEQHLLESEFEIVGKVGNGQALLEEAVRLKPDVIVSDISMPILNGIEAADRLKESGSESRIVFLTVHSDADFVRRCLSTGAFGYVAKSRITTELIPAIREALEGHIFVSQHLPYHNHA